MNTEQGIMLRSRRKHDRGTHRIFSWLLLGQWVFAVGLAIVLTPHALLAVLGGAGLTIPALVLIRWCPDRVLTKHVVAAAQMLWSALLITIIGGRIEAHFHVFASIAFVAFYRSWRVLLTAAVVVASEHLVRGLWWPGAIYGDANPLWWRSAEHLAWVGFETIVLVVYVTGSVREMRRVAGQRAELETSRAFVETQVEQRTQELRGSMERYRALVESTDAIPFECATGSLELTYMAPQTERLLGYLPAEVCGGRFFDRIVHHADRERTQVVRTDAEPLDFRVLTRGGGTRHVRALFSRRTDSIATLRGVLLDVTKQRELELELRQAHKLESVGRLAAGVAHEINTPMQYIGDSLTFVDEGVSDLITALGGVAAVASDSDLQYVVDQLPLAVARARDGTARVSQIVRSMRVFAHPESDHAVLTDLNAAITSTVTVARSAYTQVADVVLDLSPLPGVACVAGDITEVILGLLMNATHAIRERASSADDRGSITITTRHDGDHVTLAMTDSGCGIPDSVRERIFDPFFTTKPVGQGTGQGLAMAKSIVERHRGTLTFDSTVGIGSTFTVRIPVDSRPAHEVAA